MLTQSTDKDCHFTVKLSELKTFILAFLILSTISDSGCCAKRQFTFYSLSEKTECFTFYSRCFDFPYFRNSIVKDGIIIC